MIVKISLPDKEGLLDGHKVISDVEEYTYYAVRIKPHKLNEPMILSENKMPQNEDEEMSVTLLVLYTKQGKKVIYCNVPVYFMEDGRTVDRIN